MTRHVCRYSLKGRYINFSRAATTPRTPRIDATRDRAPTRGARSTPRDRRPRTLDVSRRAPNEPRGRTRAEATRIVEECLDLANTTRADAARARLFALATTAGVACVALTGASSLANAIALANAEAVTEARATDADDAAVARPTPGARRSLLYDRKAAVDKSRARYMRRSGGSRARIGRASGGGGDDDECDEEDEESECGKKKEKEEEKKEEEEEKEEEAEKQEEEEEEEDADADAEE